MTPSCLFILKGNPVALPQPAKTLVISTLDELDDGVLAIEKALSQDIAYVAGVIPYGFPRDDSGRIVVHLYKEAPAPCSLSSIPGYVGDTFTLTSPFVPEQSQSEYLASLDAIKAYLAAGDCYQVNLAQRFAASFTGNPLTAWRTLQAAHPAPHGCYFDAGDSQIFGVSPERFLSILGRKVVTEPIKGSRPRGMTKEADQALGEELMRNPKDRAENLMIVDLLRNDLGACCEPGSIQANPLFELRKFSNVQHLVSTVTGTLREDVSPLRALLQCFPGGSITGAPKKRAMEIIDELEPVPRGAYCGSFFWMDNQGNLDSNILIRTLQTEGDKLYCHGGGGIVYDSDPLAEYEESRFKVAKLMGALEEAFLKR